MASSAPAGPPATAPHVLLVEDNHAVRVMQRFLLARAGLRVTECGDFAAAWAALRAEPPAVLVLDLNLPGGSGLDLLPEVDRARTRVLIMSAMTQQHKAAQMEVQADAFLAKPFDPEVFTRLVLQLVQSAGGGPTVPGAPDPV